MDLKQQAIDQLDIKAARRRQLARITRLVLMIITGGLALYALVFLTFDLMELIKPSGDQQLISLCGEGKKGSRQIYEEQQAEAFLIHDYAFYGEQLILSPYLLTPSNPYQMGTITAINVCQKDTPTYQFDSLIDLTTLPVGDYLLQYQQGETTYQLNGGRTIADHLSLLEREGSRNKITLSSRPASPRLVLSVTSNGQRETDIFINAGGNVFFTGIDGLDDVLSTQMPKSKITINDRLDETEKLRALTGSQPLYSFLFTEKEVDELELWHSAINQPLTSAHFTVYQQRGVHGLDQDFLIRESGGKATGAVSCQAALGPDSCLLFSEDIDLRKGSATYVIKGRISSIDRQVFADLISLVLEERV